MMRIAYGLQSPDLAVQWFDTWKECEAAHQKTSGRWQSSILIYAMSQCIGVVNYNPNFGYFLTGTWEQTEDGLIDKMAKHGITHGMIFGEEVA